MINKSNKIIILCLYFLFMCVLAFGTVLSINAIAIHGSEFKGLLSGEKLNDELIVLEIPCTKKDGS